MLENKVRALRLLRQLAARNSLTPAKAVTVSSNSNQDKIAEVQMEEQRFEEKDQEQQKVRA